MTRICDLMLAPESKRLKFVKETCRMLPLPSENKKPPLTLVPSE